jgi:hypothetical protein
MLGARLHSLARNRFPKSTSFPSNETFRLVVGLKPSGIKLAAEPGTSLASARELDNALDMVNEISDCLI